ncbi:MAG: DUF3662 and FHA domain-containing protein [Actinomycetia bacterium]|nr:DUF3662 and FHA domain-containing protein [Actinomycetes bacterium]
MRGIEHKLEALFEGVFGRAFRSHVQPVELARKLTKEMDDGKAVSVSRVYAPNEYLLYLAPADRAHYREYEQALLGELAGYLIEHAQKEGYSLLSRPRILIEEDPQLSLGEFGIATRMVEPTTRHKPASPAAPPAPAPSWTPPPAAPATGAPPAQPERSPAVAAIEVNGARHAITKIPVVIGRGRDCDIVLDDPGASRRHAELRRDDGGYVIVDLGSTNGLEVNGKRIETAQLAPGDLLTIGRTKLRFAG